MLFPGVAGRGASKDLGLIPRSGTAFFCFLSVPVPVRANHWAICTVHGGTEQRTQNPHITQIAYVPPINPLWRQKTTSFLLAVNVNMRIYALNKAIPAIRWLKCQFKIFQSQKNRRLWQRWLARGGGTYLGIGDMVHGWYWFWLLLTHRQPHLQRPVPTAGGHLPALARGGPGRLVY